MMSEKKIILPSVEDVACYLRVTMSILEALIDHYQQYSPESVAKDYLKFR